MSREALIVGINHYASLPALGAPARDAEAVAQHLEQFGEFRVRRHPEMIQGSVAALHPQAAVTAQELETALIQLFKPSGKNVPHTALFYYSGHGLQRYAGIREGYLATSDATPAAGRYGLSLFWLRRLLQESPVRQRIILLDCCHSGELLNFLEADPGAREGTDRLFMAASREYEAAYEALEGGHSVFTQALLCGLNPHQAADGVVNNHRLTETVSRQLQGELQQPLFESSGSAITLTRSTRGHGRVQRPARSLLAQLQQVKYAFCPFRGAQPFTEAYGAYFYGRERATAALLQRVRSGRLCCLAGPSGSGKTSLLRAGLIYQLHQQHPDWQVRYIAAGPQPLQQLAAAFVDPQLRGIERVEQLHRIEALLRCSPDGFPPHSLIALLQEQGEQPWVLVVDQLEALWEAAVCPQERQQFFSLLAAALRSPLPVRIVLGLREDRRRQLQASELGQPDACLPLEPMTYDELKSTVVGPLDRLGLAYEANLIYSLLLDVVGTPAELTWMQRLLRALWQRRQSGDTAADPPRLTLGAYGELGGLPKVLQRQADCSLRSCSDAEQAVAQRIFLSLSGPGGSRQAAIGELISTEHPTQQVMAVLNTLAAQRLVVISQREGAVDDTTVVDMAHGSLGRTWEPLVQWQRQPHLRQQQHLETQAQRWQESAYLEPLLQGSELRTALHLQTCVALSLQAERYLAASQRHQRRRQQQRWLVWALIPASMVLGMALASYRQHAPQPISLQPWPRGQAMLNDSSRATAYADSVGFPQQL